MTLWFKLTIALLLAGLWFWLIRRSFRLAPFIPSLYRDIDRGLSLADVGPDDTVLDLGSGTGKAVLRAHQKYGARARGVELIPLLHGLARMRLWIVGHPEEVTLEQGDVFKQDLKNVDVVYIYGTASTLKEHVAPWLREHAPEGLRVVSNLYPITGLEPTATEEDGWGRKSYLYHL